MHYWETLNNLPGHRPLAKEVLGFRHPKPAVGIRRVDAKRLDRRNCGLLIWARRCLVLTGIVLCGSAH
jgi:hypothetical protein